jgi:hypothetical protein
MKIYTVEFTGYWPVGACAIVVAKDRGHAKRLLEADLAERGLTQTEEPLKVEDFKLVDTSTAHVEILNDGDY